MSETSQIETAKGETAKPGVLPLIGWGLLIASLGLWLLLLVVPFLAISGTHKLAAAGVMVVTSEILFWLGAVAAGPDAVRRIKSWWRAK